MEYQSNFQADARTRADVDASNELLLLEFGTNWCGHCQAAQPAIRTALQGHALEAVHVKIEDGPGRALGRSFRVKLWPTLVLMRNGQELGRVVRPPSVQAVTEVLDQGLV